MRRRSVAGIVVPFVVAVGLVIFPTAASAEEMASAGPLTSITVSPDLNCDVRHAADSAPEFFGSTACGTLVATGGTLYGPADIPAGDAASPRTAFTPVSQTSGGTEADPLWIGADQHWIVTEVDAGEDMSVNQIDSYIVGTEYYSTLVWVHNNTDEAIEAIVYRAGDCFLQNSDKGFGNVSPVPSDPPLGSAITCRGIQVDENGDPVLDENGQPLPGDRIEQWIPLTEGSHYYEANFNEVWAHIGSQQPFPDTCRCDEYIDNGAGLSWTLTIPAGESATVMHQTAFSPTGDSPIDPRECVEDGLAVLAGTGIASGIVHSAVEPLILGASPELATAVHDLNCNWVDPLEDQLDALLTPAG